MVVVVVLIFIEACGCENGTRALFWTLLFCWLPIPKLFELELPLRRHTVSPLISEHWTVEDM